MSLHNPEGLNEWTLGGEWIELDFDDYKPSIVHSENYTGSLHQVSKELGGKPVGRVIRHTIGNTEVVLSSTLLGCFVAKELRPRFLGTRNSIGGFLLYTTRHILAGNTTELKVSDEDFKLGLLTLKTKLWKI